MLAREWGSSAMDARVFFLMRLRRHLGEPYSWGGEGGEEDGWDCSGLIHSGLKDLSRFWPDLYDGIRRSAHGYWEFFRSKECEPTLVLQPGALVFWWRPYPNSPERMRAFHIAAHMLRLPGEGPVSIESGGGGSATTALRAAFQRNAQVRYSASDRHGPQDGRFFQILDPIGDLIK